MNDVVKFAMGGPKGLLLITAITKRGFLSPSIRSTTTQTGTMSVRCVVSESRDILSPSEIL